MNGHKLLKERGLLARYKIDERVIATRKQRRAVVRYLTLLDRKVEVAALQKRALSQLSRSFSHIGWYRKLVMNLSFVAVLSVLQGQFAQADELLSSSVDRHLVAQTRDYISAESVDTARVHTQSLQSLHLLANQNVDQLYQQTQASLTDDAFFVADNAILTVIDPGLDQWELLADAVQAGEILLLKPGQPPLEQIIAKVKTMGPVKVLNILSHGTDGEIYLAGQRISARNLAEYEQQFKDLGALLTEDGQLQLFGCDVAKSELGKNFVTELAQITGADVAGSVNLTGSGIEQTNQSSDWDLEYFTGEQTIGVAQTFNSKRLLAYNNVLQTVYTFEDLPGYMCYGYGECSSVVSDLTLRAVSSNPIHAVSIYGNYRVIPLPGQEQGLEYAGSNNGELWLMGGGVQNAGVPRSLEVSKTDASDFTPNSVKVRIWTYRSVHSTSSPDATFFEIVGLNSSNVQVASIKYESVYDDDTIDINFSNPASSVYTRNNGGYFTGAPTLTQSGSFATVRKLQFKTGPYQFGIDDLSIGALVVNATPVNTVAPAISGTATVGNALTGSTGSWTDADGDTLTYSRQWYRADDASGTNRTAISSATGATYTLTTSDAHKYIQVVVTANDGNGGVQTANSSYTQVANTAPVNSLPPSISGTATVGNALSTTNGTWSDADGDGRSFTYQWYRADDNSGTNAAAIGGATSASYTLTTSDAHKFLRVVVTASDGKGGATPANSAYTAITNSAPVNSVLPSIIGTATVGSTLINTNGTWSDADGDGRSFTYQWYRADDNSGTNAVAIGGATSASYTLTSSDVNKYLRVVVTANDGKGGITPASSAYTAVLNNDPSDIALSNTSVNQSGGIDAEVGTLSSTDADGETAFTYTLVAGVGDTHNTSFNISGSSLRASDAAVMTADNYSVRIRTTDSAGGTFEKVFTLTVIDDMSPSVTIGSNRTALKAGESATLTFTLSESANNFTDADVSVTGGTLSGFAGSGTSYTAEFTPAINSTVTATVDIAAGVFTDAAGNDNTAATQFTMTVDTEVPEAPSAPLLDPASDSGTAGDNITNDTTPTLTGTAEAGSTVTLYDTDGVTVLGTGTATGGNWSITSTVLGEGDHELTVTATDAAGNVSVASTALILNINTTAHPKPPAPALAPASDTGSSNSDGITRLTDLTLQGAVGSVEPYAVIHARSSIDGSLTGTTANADGSWTLDVTGLSTGSHSLQVTATNIAGNVSEFSDALAVVIDDTAPVIGGVAFDQANVNVVNQAAISISLAGAEIGTRASYTINSNNGGAEVSATDLLVSSATQQFTGIDVSGLNDGTLTVSLTLTDTAGNTSTATTGTIAKDVNAPTVSSITITDGDYAEGDVINISVTLSEDVTVSGPNSTLAISIGGTNRLAVFVSENAGVLLYQYTVQSGDNTDVGGVVVASDGLELNGDTIVDAGSNNADLVFGQTAHANAQVDTEAPATPAVAVLATADDTGVSDSDNITRNAQPSLSGTAEPDSTITIYSDMDNVVGTTTADGSGNWSLTLPAALSDNTHQITVVATDAAGNDSPASAALTLVIDTTDPVLTGVSFDDPAVDGTNYQSLSVTLAGAEVGTVMHYTITSSGGADEITGSVTVTDASQSITGLNVSSLPDGNLTISVKLVDTAGNESAAVTHTISKDVNPVLTLPANPAPIVDGSDVALPGVAVAGTTSVSISVELSVGADEGALTLEAHGATVTGNGSGSVTVAGTLTAVNNTLATLEYSAPENFTTASSGPVGILIEVDDGIGTDADLLEIEVYDRPDIDNLQGNTVSFIRGSSNKVAIDAGADAVVSDLDNLDFDSGSLSVTISAGGNPAQDLLSFLNDGAVTLDPDTALAGSHVQVDDGTSVEVIGTLVHDISEGHDLVINLNTDATPARVALVLQSLAYSNSAANAALGARTLSIELFDGSYVDAMRVVTTSVNVQEPPVDSGNVIDNNQSNVNVVGTVTITPNGVLNGGNITGTINNSGVVTGNVTLGANSVINGGTISGNIMGNAAQPARINGATVTSGASLSNVIIGANTVLQPGVRLGENVRFESEASIPGGLDLTGALRTLNWSNGDARGVVMLDGDILMPGSGGDGDNDMTIIRAIQLLGEYEPAGNDVEQDDSTGEILVVTSDFQAAVLPVQVSKAGPDEVPGTYINENGDIVFVTVNQRVVLSYPVLASKPSFLAMLQGAGLQLNYDERANMQVFNPAVTVIGDREVQAVTREGGEYYYSARPDVVSVPAHRSQTPGLVEYPLQGLGTPRGLSIVFEDDGELREQDLVPASPDWFGLKDALLDIPGITNVSIDAQGILSVTLDGQTLRARLEYVVFIGREAARDNIIIRDVGDKTGNGTTDYEVVYPNGDVQYLYVF